MFNSILPKITIDKKSLFEVPFYFTLYLENYNKDGKNKKKMTSVLSDVISY
jgi:hypothetical protein